MERRPRSALSCLALALAFVPGARAEAAPACESLAIFGTACARCHEAECSGRLTFADPARASDHVRRFTGALGDERVAELIALLRVTKEQCRLDAAAAASCGAPPWDAARLAGMRARSGRAWFVPLPASATGAQRLVLRFDRDTVASLRIATARFDVVHESSRATRERSVEAAFAAPGGETLFVRVQTDADAELLELRVAEEDGD